MKKLFIVIKNILVTYKDIIVNPSDLCVNGAKNRLLFYTILFFGIIGFLSIFTVREGEQASAFFAGKAKRDYTTPGLQFKYPWEFVNKVDKRLLLYSAKAMILQEKTKKKLLIDYFGLYRIENPKTYFTKVISIDRAEHRIADHIASDIAAVIGENTSEDIITNKRQLLLDTIKNESNKGLDDIDIHLKFVSFNRVELPDKNKPAVFDDMISDRNKISQGYIAEGKKIGDSIRSYADFQVTEIIANANLEASIIMGRADSTRLNMLNTAYAKSKALFRLYNEIETFEKSYSKNTEWILTPDKMVLIPK